MLYLVQGRSGTGKTHYTAKILAEKAGQGDNKLLWLIPEQSSFESEKMFLKLLDPSICRNISVMSFTRLYDMVMRVTGGFAGTPIDDGARKILMSLAVEDCAYDLDLYKKQAGKPQLTDLMINAVKEFKTCGISSKRLREQSKKIKNTDLSEKLHDVSLIYDFYNAHLEGSNIDPLDNNARLERRIAETRFFDGYTVVVDGFSGFTAQEMKILMIIMEQSKDFYMTFCLDSEREDELFYSANKTLLQITEKADSENISIAPVIKLCDNYRCKNSEISFLEKNIYRINSDVYKQEYNGGITLCKAADIFEECSYIADKIYTMAVSGECRYKDIAIVFRNTGAYRGVLDSALDSRNIPYFMSKPRAVINKPIMLLVLSAFEYVLSKRNCDPVIAIAKSGIIGISDYSASVFENYIYVWDLKPNDLCKEFVNSPKGYTENYDSENDERLKKINNIREKIITPLAAFENKLKRDNVGAYEISSAVYELLIDYKVDKCIKHIQDEFSEESSRLWDMLMNIINKMYVTLGERPVAVKRYYELIKMVISAQEISDIPQTTDQVIVGNAESIRLSNPYAVFVIGAVNGEFPHTPVSSGVFNDSERQTLISEKLPLYDGLTDLFKQEKYLVYSAVSAPSSKLFITYYTADLKGKETAPSSIVSELLRLLPQVKKENTSLLSAFEKLSSERSAFEQCALRYNENSAYSEALREYFSDKPEYNGRLAAVDRTVGKKDFWIKNKKTAEVLFGKDKNVSASQVETFYNCRFQYFLTYGLRLKERKKARIDALAYGSLIHYLLEKTLEEYKKGGYAALSDEDMEKLIDRLLEEYLENVLGGKDNKSERFKCLYYRYKDNAERLIRHITDELSQSEFKPVDFELAIGGSEPDIDAYTVTDTNGNKVILRGFVDRIDIMKKDDKQYIRVVDYKTGKKQFHISDVLYGLNMQMLLYLSAIEKNGGKRYGENIVPSGVLYMPAEVTAVKAELSDSDEAVKKEQDKALRMNGIILDNRSVIEGMEKKIEGRYIPIKTVKSGAYDKNSDGTLISDVQLNMLFKKADEKLAEMSEALTNGDICAVPASGDYDPCKWCKDPAVCGHEDDDISDDVVSLEKAKVMERLLKEQTGEDKKCQQ